MKHILKTGIVVLAFSIMPTNAQAQSNDIYDLRTQNTIDVRAGVHFTMPLGGKRIGHAEDKARVGLKMGFARSYESKAFVTSDWAKMDVLDLGWRLDGKPSLFLYGQDMYTPLFDPLSADESDESGEAKPPSKLNGSGIPLVIGAGLIIAVGTIALANEIEDDIRDCLFNIHDPKCAKRL